MLRVAPAGRSVRSVATARQATAPEHDTPVPLSTVARRRGKYSPHRHPEQKPHPGHDAVAIADAHAGLRQVQLKQADVLGCRRVRGSLQKRRKPLAAVDVAPPRVRSELARGHIFDHPLAQRADGIRAHRKAPILSEVETPRSSRRGPSSATAVLSPGHRARGYATPAKRAIAKRFSALAQSGPSS